MIFFNIDQHISVIEDMRHIFRALGHTVEDWSISNHTWVFNRQKTSIPLLEGEKWKNVVKKKLWKKFCKTYRTDLQHYDAFIACYSPMFAMLYQEFDKPMILNIPIRYEHPFSFDKSSWKKFNKFIQNGVDNGRIILVANSLYDKYYCEYFVEREVCHIPSMCDYYGKTFHPQRDEFLLCSQSSWSGIHPLIIEKKSTLGAQFSIDQMLDYKGLIHFPYQVSFMSLFEQYSMSIPLFFPTIDFLLESYQQGKDVLKEVSWNRYFNRSSGSFIKGNGPWDPNDYKNIEAVSFWLRYADFYDSYWMPHIQQFKSIKHLNELISSCDVCTISQSMSIHNKIRKQNILNLWQNKLTNLI